VVQNAIGSTNRVDAGVLVSTMIFSSVETAALDAC
jgi:hypothetical protein